MVYDVWEYISDIWMLYGMTFTSTKGWIARGAIGCTMWPCCYTTQLLNFLFFFFTLHPHVLTFPWDGQIQSKVRHIWEAIAGWLPALPIRREQVGSTCTAPAESVCHCRPLNKCSSCGSVPWPVEVHWHRFLRANGLKENQGLVTAHWAVKKNP